MNPYQVIWETTLRCNMQCIHCGSVAGKSRPKELTTEEALSVIHQLDDIGTESLVLMGGEPFLRKDWFTLAKEVNKTNIDLIFISNGYLQNETILKNLSELNINNLGVSIDGGTPGTHDFIRRKPGSFKHCFDFIDKLNKLNIPVTVVTSVMKNNLNELPVIRDLLSGKVLMWQLQVACPVGRFKNELMLSKNQFYSLGEFINNSQGFGYQIFGADNCGYFSKSFNDGWQGCQAGKRVLGIRSNGDILSCLSINDNSYVEGNVKKRSLVDMWNDPGFAKFNKEPQFGSNCSSCFNKETCGGGCSSMSISTTGVPHNNHYCYHLIEKGVTKIA